jgi:hypothetical protein
MEKMDKVAEGRIVRAIEEAIELTNSGTPPNEAIQKQAEAHKFGPQVVQRMVEAYNTSRTLAHLKQASGHDRANDFPLADAAEILGKMYPKDVTSPRKEAAARAHHSYDRPEQVNFMRKRAASPPPLVEEKPGPIDRDPEHVAHEKYGKYHALVRKEADARTRYRQQHYQLWAQVKAAAEHFKKLYHTPFAEVEERVASEHGVVGKSINDLVYEFGKLKEKRAELKEIRQFAYDAEGDPYFFFDSAVKVAHELHKAAEAVIDAQEEKEAFMKKAGIAEEKTIPVEMQARALDGVMAGGPRRPFEKNALLPAPSLSGSLLLAGGMGALGLKDPDKPAAREEAELQAMDPIHDAEMRGIKTKAMLNDMLVNDPIVSSYDPDDVRQAFNSLSSLSPTLMTQPGVVRAMLRRMLQQEGVIEPHEATQLTDVEKNLKSLERATTLGPAARD